MSRVSGSGKEKQAPSWLLPLALVLSPRKHRNLQDHLWMYPLPCPQLTGHRPELSLLGIGSGDFPRHTPCHRDSSGETPSVKVESPGQLGGMGKF